MIKEYIYVVKILKELIGAVVWYNDTAFKDEEDAEKWRLYCMNERGIGHENIKIDEVILK